jgi:hypothetical protein
MTTHRSSVPKGVAVALRARFPQGDIAALQASLDLYGTEPHEPERHRVQLAIIELCGGGEARLAQLVRDAKIDYRDILAAQELGPHGDARGQALQDEARALIERWGTKTP